MSIKSIKPTEEEISPYMHGLCFTFAIALRNIFGYDLVLLVWDDEGRTPDHAFAVDWGTEKAIDASGITTYKKMLSKYPGDVESDEDIEALSDQDYIDDAEKFILKYHSFYNTRK